MEVKIDMMQKEIAHNFSHLQKSIQYFVVVIT